MLVSEVISGGERSGSIRLKAEDVNEQRLLGDFGRSLRGIVSVGHERGEGDISEPGELELVFGKGGLSVKTRV